MKKTISVIISLVLTLALLSGCSGTESAGVYDVNCAVNKLDSQVVASNDLFELSWNKDGKFVSLSDKETGKIWSTVPYEYFESGGTSANVNSPLNITVVNAAKAEWDTISGYSESVSKDRVSVEKLKNGIKVTYYFDNYLISIPVSYELKEEGLSVSVDSSEIVEEGSKVLLSVALAPFLCSAQNVSEDSYLFIPSGNGALMYVDERAEGTRKYTAEVYGNDQSRLFPEEAVDETKIYMPVYGVKSDESALFAVINEGAECAEIYAEAGNRRTGYSTVYPTFYLRGYDVVETDQWLWGYRDLSRISDKKINTKISIDFYPLSGEKANLEGMVGKYKECLLTHTESEEEAPLYALNILGGVTYKSAAWGIPHKELYTLTSFKEAEQIITSLNKNIKASSAVVMQGFSSTGIDIGKIGGGFELAGNYGSDKELSSLMQKCSELQTKLSFDFDIIRYSDSSKYSYMLDSAKSATLRTADKFGINIPLRSYNEEGYRLLKRAKLDDAINELIKFANKKSLKAVGMSSFGSMAYSDFGEEKFSVKGNMASQVADNITKIKEKGIEVYVSDANGYAAAKADLLLNVPADNGNYFALDTTIPFYQMVFCGTKPMYSGALNLSEDIDKAVMQAVSTGVRFGFTVANNYDTVCASSKTEKLYGTKFSNVEGTIVELVTKYADFYEKISGCAIKSYKLLDNGITHTVFENGTEVYANHRNEEVSTEMGVFEPYEIKISG